MIAGTLRVGFRNFELETELDTKEYDLLTVTAGDYTVELDISDA
jgi:hypothetical protein